jgi:hypothetical protein
MNQITENLLRNVVSEFEFEGKYVGTVLYGSGHINDTFAVYFQFEDYPRRYILQRINTNVFRNPIELMENVQGVTSYLFRMIAAAHGDPYRETLNLISTKAGSFYHVDPEGGYWRAYLFVEDTITLQQTRNAKDFYNSARSLGKFQMLLADYPAQTLHETITLFHDTPDRIRQFKEALAADTKKRAAKVQGEIDFVLIRESFTHTLVDLLAQGKLPLRVTHNDTKLNNILIDKESGQGICIIDLDTVMPGLSLYDFGDSIRFGATTAAEDEQDPSKVHFDIDLFEAFSKGYLETAGSILSDEEIRNLATGAKMMTLECGIRFLTDYLNGDIYFKTEREGQNLDRCRTQLKLVAEMEEQWDAMTQIIDKYRK